MRTFPGEIRMAAVAAGGAGFRESGRRRGAAWSSAPAPSATPTVGDTSTRGPRDWTAVLARAVAARRVPFETICRPLPTGAGHPGASRPADSLADVLDRRDRAHPCAPSPGARPWCRGRSLPRRSAWLTTNQSQSMPPARTAARGHARCRRRPAAAPPMSPRGKSTDPRLLDPRYRTGSGTTARSRRRASRPELFDLEQRARPSALGQLFSRRPATVDDSFVLLVRHDPRD